MSIESPVGTLDIKNATLRVGKLEVSNIQGIDTALNVTRANSVLIYDDQASTTTFNGTTSSAGVRDTVNGYLDVSTGYVYWGQKLPNSWVMEFEMDIRSGTNAGSLNLNVFSSINTGSDGYSIVFDDNGDNIILKYDGATIATAAVSGLFTASENWQKVVINYERGTMIIGIGGERKLYYQDIERETPYTTGEYINFSSASADGRKIRDLKITNGSKWIYAGESNVVYTQGSVGVGVTDPTTALDVSGTVKATVFDGDGSAITNISSANVGDFASNVVRIENLETSNGHIWSSLQSNVTILRDEIDSNLATARTDLQSNVTILRDTAITFTGIKTFQNDVILESNLRVKGELLVANTVNMTVSDPILELGSNNQNTGDVGLVMTRHGTSNSNVAIFFDESDDILKLGYTLNGAEDSTLEFDSNALAVSVQGALTATSVSGNGSGLTSLNATNISSGTINKDRLPTTLNNTTIESAGHGTLTISDSSGDNQSITKYTTTSFNWTTGIHGQGGSGGEYKIANGGDLATNTRVTIDTAGQVGIATDSPAYKLDVHGTSNVGALTTTSVSGNGSGLTSLNAGNLASGTVPSARLSLTASDIPNLSASKITSGTLTRPISTTTGTFSGDVGIGTTSPTDLLDVHYPTPSYGSSVGTEEGSLTVSSGAEHSNAAVYFRTPFNAAAPAKMAIFSSGGGHSGANGGGLHFCLENTNNNTTKVDLNNSKMVVKADGKVGIATTSPAYTLDVHGTSNVGALTTTSVSGDGSSLTSLNADNLSSGTVPSARLSLAASDIPDLSASKITSGTLGRPISTTTGTFSGVVTCNDVLKLEAGSTTGDTSVESTHKTNTYIRFGTAGAGNDWAYLRQIGGTNLIKLALDFHDDNEARFEIRKVNSSAGSGSGEVATTVFSVDDGAVTATSFSGSGSSLTSLNADNLTSGTVSSDRLSLAASDIPDLSASKITSGTLGRPISTTTGTFSGDLTVSGKIYNYNYTEVDINAPDVVSGTWTASNNSSNWGDPKFNNTYDRYRYNDASGYVEYTIPAGMKSAYLSQLQWNTGGYVDVHGVQSDGGLVFLRRINTRQAVENTNEGNPDQHDGQTITFAGSGLEHYSNIRLTNKLGRFHLTGLAFTPNENECTEGTGMVHSAQISNLGTSTGIPTSTGTGANGTWGISITGNAASATNVRVDRDDTGDTSMYLTMVNNDTAENSKRLYMDSNLVYDNKNNELKLNSLQITVYIYHSGDTDSYFGFDDADHFRIVEGGGTRFQVDSNGYIGIGTTSPTSILTTYGGGLHDGDGAFTSKVCATLYVGRGGGSGASTLDQGTGAILEFRHDSDYKSVTIESVSEASYSQDIGLLFKTTDTSDGPQERMRIDAHGNVGIGTDSPEYKLDVHGSSNVGALTATSISGPLSGNADTATALETARTIGGVSFDGTTNINLPGVNTTGNQNTSGNAATATALETARTIGGVSFDGTTNINLPGVNTTGNQD